jgi:hypothetical protein
MVMLPDEPLEVGMQSFFLHLNNCLLNNGGSNYICNYNNALGEC